MSAAEVALLLLNTMEEIGHFRAHFIRSVWTSVSREDALFYKRVTTYSVTAIN